MLFIAGTSQLSTRDPDTPLNELIFTLVKAPWQGTVVRNKVALRVGDTFTNEDVSMKHFLLRFCKNYESSLVNLINY